MDNGGPAFPEIRTGYDESAHEHTGEVYSVGGMSLRDYFAAKALQRLVANQVFFTSPNWQGCQRTAVEFAYATADLMLEQRELDTPACSQRSFESEG